MNSIRRRLTAILTLHLIVAVSLGGVLIWLWARHSLLSQFDATLMARAELIQSTVEEDDGHLEIEFNLTKLAAFQKDAAAVHYQIRSRSGQPLISSEQFGGLRIPDTVWTAGTVPAFQSFETPDGHHYRSLRVNFDAADDRDGDFRGLNLLILRDSREPQSALHRLAAAVAAAAAVSLVFLIFLVRRTLQTGLKPLELFASRTEAINLSQLPQTIPHGEEPAELRPIVDKLNELLHRVHQSLLRERRFTRDVAHELRTPVAELKSISELAARWKDQVTPEAFADVGEIATEMESLVAGLTLLNRLDATPVSPEPAAVHPAGVLRQITGRLESSIAAGGLTLVPPEGADHIVWQTDPALWRIAASNLIENAVAYSPPGSRIEVILTSSSLTVRNPAPGITGKDIPLMTHPFWRKDASRHDQSHSGLGMALVESIARRLNLQFHVSLGEGGVLSCTLSIPEHSGGG